MKADLSILKLEEPSRANTPTCADYDEDCADIGNKVRCWLYAPERGMCPYLREEKKP